MVIIVKHEEMGIEYLLVGTGYSFYKDSIPSPLGGSFFPDVEEGETKMVAVCDAQGEISWLPSDAVKVISIDGVMVSQILEGRNDTYEKSEKCPACGYAITARMMVCPSCELTLIDEED